MRSLRWGWEVLAELQADLTLPEIVRNQAAAILETYPSPSALLGLLKQESPSIAEESRGAIDAARALLEDIQLQELGSTSTRRSVLYTLRHFPAKGSVPSKFIADRLEGIKGWIADDTGEP